MTDIVAGAVGAQLSSWFSDRQLRALDVRLRRRAAGDDLASQLERLRDLLQRVDDAEPTEAWVSAIRATYRAVDNHTYTLPPQWRHLNRSVRFAIGESTGLGLVDFGAAFERLPISPDSTWIDFGRDYVAYALSAVRQWREPYSQRAARRVKLLGFDEWLRVTRRYESGIGVWPDDRR